MHSSRAISFARTLIARTTALSVNMIAGIVVARALLPEGRGEYAVAVAVATTTVALGHLSIEQAHVSLWHRGASPSALASNAMALGLSVGTAASIVAWIALVVAGDRLVPEVDNGAILVVLAAVPFNVVALYLNGLNVLGDRIHRVNFGGLLAAAAQAAGVIAVAGTATLTVRWAAMFWAIAAAAPLVIVTRRLGVRLRTLSFSLARSVMRIGLKYHLGLAALFLLFRVDVFLLNGLSTQEQVGLYAVAVLLAELVVNLVAAAATEVLLPRLLEGTQKEAAGYTARVFRLNMLVVMAAAIVIGALSPLVIPGVFGSAYRGSVAPLLALLPGVVALGLIRPVTVFLVRLDRPLVVSALVWGAFVVNVVLNLALIPAFDAVGAALASSVAYGMLTASYLMWFRRAGSVSVEELLPRVRETRALLRVVLTDQPSSLEPPVA